MMMKVQIPAAAGSAAIQSGILPQTVGQFLESPNAEAAYFTAEDGMRTAFFFFEMEDPTVIPSVAEPFFGALEAKITFSPVMNVDEMRAGVERAAASP